MTLKTMQQSTTANVQMEKPVLTAKNVTICYGANQAVKDVSLSIHKNRITSIIGPSGCGKSTLLRAFNRMNDFIPNASMMGNIYFGDVDIYSKDIDPVDIRRSIGMVFQKPNPFPKTIYENISWGPSINGIKTDLNELVEKSLEKAALWEEIKEERLYTSALNLSGGQQQRLCIARALAMEPEIILMDEPCSALDPVSTAKIEDLMFELKKRYTIVIVTHNMQQASRISDYTAFMENGTLVEFDNTVKVFTRPKNKRTEDYVTGRFG